MLKFLALGRPELWCGNKSEWKEWLRARMDDIAAITTIEQVKQWAESGEAEVVEPLPPPCAKAAGGCLRVFDLLPVETRGISGRLLPQPGADIPPAIPDVDSSSASAFFHVHRSSGCSLFCRMDGPGAGCRKWAGAFLA